jgi:hypothetical protein
MAGLCKVCTDSAPKSAKRVWVRCGGHVCIGRAECCSRHAAFCVSRCHASLRHPAVIITVLAAIRTDLLMVITVHVQQSLQYATSRPHTFYPTHAPTVTAPEGWMVGKADGWRERLT